MVTPNIKLYYFNIKGRGEAVRLALHYGNVPFEDVRINGPDWPAYKEKMPFHQVPVLEVDGVMIPESHAVLRLVEHLASLSPKNIYDRAIADSVISYVGQFSDFFGQWLHAPEPEKNKMGNELATVQYPQRLANLEAFLKLHVKNGFVRGSFNIADLVIYDFVNVLQAGEIPYISSGYENFNTLYPTLFSIFNTVAKLPKIIEYNKSQKC